MMTTTLATVVMAVSSVVCQAPAFEEIAKVDVHAHYLDDMPAFAEMLERINMRVVNICVFKGRSELMPALHGRAAELASKYDAMAFGCTFDLTGVGEEGFAERTAEWLDRWFDEGAVLTKIWKEVGMATRLPDGSFLMPDAPELDPVYEHLTRRGKVLLSHFGDPIEAWRPLTETSMHYKYFSNNPEWYMYGREGYPTHEAISAAYDRMLGKHPELVVIGAHLGSLEHDLDALAARLDRYGNFHVDVSARTPDLKAHPREKVRAFFERYQDRILYGLDQGRFAAEGAIPESEQMEYAERMEGWYRSEYGFYAEELGLPREVLETFYHGNAERLLGLGGD